MSYPIPRDAFDDRIAIVGTAGSGKTYLTMGAMEHLLARKSRVIGVDPLGVMWGLRLCADGKTPSPFQPVIFGGAHGDLPISEHSGALIGEAVAASSESCIIDLSLLGAKAAERRFMLAFLTALYRYTNKEPVHLVIDEADMFAPQRLLDKDGDAAKLLGMMETIVRRGRVKGFIPWLITQRPAVLSKDVLSQADGLVALKLTAKQDRDAIKGWVESTADQGQWKTIDAALPTKQRGEGVLWMPARGILRDVEFPEKATFDSSRTPKRGEKISDRKLAPLDLGKLKDRLATVETEAKANDPRALKAEIGNLKAQIGKLSAAKPSNETAKSNEADLERAEKTGFNKGLSFAHSTFRVAVLEMQNAVAFQNDNVRKELAQLEAISTSHFRNLNKAIPATPVQSVENYSKAIPAARPVTKSAPRAPRPAGDTSGPAQRILDGLAELEAMGVRSIPRVLAAFMAGYSHVQSKGFVNALSALRTDGNVDYPNTGTVSLTDAGRAIAKPAQAVLSTKDVQDRVVRMLGGASERILVPLIETYPEPMARSDLAGAAGYGHVQSKGFVNALSRLRTLGFIDYPSTGAAVATDLLFPG